VGAFVVEVVPLLSTYNNGGGIPPVVSDNSDIQTVLVNLTPHSINLIHGDETVNIEPSGAVARCKREQVQVGTVNGTPIFQVRMGEVENLPEVVEGTVYIVSRITAEGAQDRNDLLCTNDPVRDEEGNIIGCKSFSKV